EISSMETVDPEVAQAVLDDFQRSARHEGATIRGGPQVAHRFLNDALGPTRANEVLEAAKRPPVGSELKTLQQVAPEALWGSLRGEHPQTLALILAHLEPAAAARMLTVLDPDEAADALVRMAKIERVSPDTLALVERAVGARIEPQAAGAGTGPGGPEAVAKVLHRAVAGTDERLLEAISRRDQEVAERVRAAMFVFEDLLLVDGKGIQRLLREIEAKDLALALKGVTPELAKHIKSNMSERAAGALEEEMEMLGPVRVKEVEAVHARIIEVVRQLQTTGEITVRGQGGGDDVIP
ncbi:MAG TPA: flagellar motor switch protein FliG, partial [Dongiaceae bacterium]|nr:flagellar motor switch protein FliG [Dongiaceae bacterium]